MAAKPAKRTAKQKSSKNGPPIFLIHDDDGQRKKIAADLTNAGFNVHSYFTAREFLLDRVEKNAGVVIAGYRLREMNGVELIEQLTSDRIKIGSSRNEVRDVKLICWQGFTNGGQLGLMSSV